VVQCSFLAVCDVSTLCSGQSRALYFGRTEVPRAVRHGQPRVKNEPQLASADVVLSVKSQRKRGVCTHLQED